MIASPVIQLDEFVSAFEKAAAQGAASIEDHLPPSSHPLYLPVLRELVRVDLELAWEQGRSASLNDYLRRHPELALDRSSLQEIAFEDYRLRCQAGLAPRAEEYANAYGIDIRGWPGSVGVRSSEWPPTRALSPEEQVDFSYSDSLLQVPERTSWPVTGETFAGYRLEEELGRGSFARVFRARESALSGRPVVLKIAPQLFAIEAQTLSRLQHTHIVPIFSLHQEGPFAGLCMPHFGSLTLVSVLQRLRSEPQLPRSGRWLRALLPAGDSAALDSMERRSYNESVLWIIARLADGLSHAHERGILHRDIKPANLLLADDGTPLLLDFNLADDQESERDTAAGGTLPYMAPEYLESLSRRQPHADERCDVFALGIVLYELLTSQFPFPTRQADSPEIVPILANDRCQPIANVRAHNPAIDPSIAAIVHRCLEPDPDRRYLSAEALAHDIDRHLANLPLKHAHESTTQRLRKWARRHPALTSSASVATLAGCCLLLLLGLLVAGMRSRQRLTAEGELTRLRDESTQIGFLLSQRDSSALLGEGVQQCQDLARAFGLEREDWQRTGPMASLAPEKRSEARERWGELLWLWARADAWGKGRADEESWRLLAQAEACFDEERPGALSLQRASWLDRAGKSDEARAVRKTIPEPRTARESYLEVLFRAGEGRWSESLPLLRQLTQEKGERPVPWMLLASAYAESRQPDRARICAEVGTSLAPDWPLAWFHQGVLALNRNDHSTAVQCFTRVLKMRPAMHEARLNLALAELGTGKTKDAIAHLDRLEEEGATISRLYFIRARAHKLLGDEESERRDLVRGRAIAPTDEVGWHARAVSYLPDDPKSALADLDAILKRYPDSILGLRNRAHVYSEYLKRTPDALADLTRLLQLRPDDILARAGRGVLFARLGKRKDAHDDAQIVEQHATEAGLLYQAACVYALTSKERRIDRQRALRLLRKAFAQEARWVSVAPKDRDLANLHADPDFRELLQKAKEWHGEAGRKKKLDTGLLFVADERQ